MHALAARSGGLAVEPGGPVERTAERMSAPAMTSQTLMVESMPTRAGRLSAPVAGAAALLGAAAIALIWANVSASSYEAFWAVEAALRVGPAHLALSLREWVNSGLMSVFFFAVGLEARHAFDMGELRERGRIVLPLLAGLTGMLIPVGIYLAVNAGRGPVHGWGAAMSTDTAFALGLLALLGSRLPDKLRTFILTVSVVDDLVALAVIAVFYSGRISFTALGVAVGVFALVLLARANGVRGGVPFLVAAAVIWVCLVESGVDPVVTGLAMGLLTAAYPAARADLEHTTGLFRLFREQPSAELARQLRRGLATAISANDRLRQLCHPWTTFVIVPVFALANAGVEITGPGLRAVLGSPVALGIALGYLLGKPVGIVAAARLTTAVSRGRLQPTVGWGAVSAGGATAGAGFTVSLLVASLALHGEQLVAAKVGILVAVLGSFLLTWVVTRVMERLPRGECLLAQLGTGADIVDLVDPVDPARDHVKGPADATVTVVEYGDFDCPYRGRAEAGVRELLTEQTDVRYVWRHLPLPDVHPNAQLAAEAAEAAGAQQSYWAMHELLQAHQGPLRTIDLMRYARTLGLDAARFHRDLREHRGAARIAQDVSSADRSGVAGTPTFFINGHRHHGGITPADLAAAVSAARDRAALLGDEVTFTRR